MRTTVGQLLVDEVLPEDFRGRNVPLSRDTVDEVLAEIGRKYPEKYKDVSHRLMQLGREAVYKQAFSYRMEDLLPVVERADLLKHIEDQRKKIQASDASPQEKEEALLGVMMEVQKFIKDETYKRALEGGNPFALQVQAKARGNPEQLAALLSSPGLYLDARGRPVPIFIGRSYAEGLLPHEYWASTYGARQSVISTKFATRDAGDLGKQLNQTLAPMLVTSDDCGAEFTGLPVKSDDADNIGAVLARSAAGIPAGTVISRPLMAKLKSEGVDTVVVRSPLTCAMDKGVCKLCVGHRENGQFPKLGENVGLNAASAIAERVAQSALNVKHGGGVAKGKQRVFSGFDVVEQLAQVPETFPNEAALAETAGKVEKIELAPQGGFHVYVNGVQHYVGQDKDVLAKEGDEVEEGDQLSTGIVNPRRVVQFKGLGEGRRFFVNRFTQALRESGYDTHRRNVELIGRGMLDFVEVTDPDGAGVGLPGDFISYNTVAKTYRPRKDAEVRDVKNSVGMYLEQPTLHYTLGTKLTKKMAGEIAKYGGSKVTVHSQPPPFEPYMLRLRESTHMYPDWMAQLGASYLESNLLKNVHRGATSQLHGLHPLPALAQGVEFGRPPKGQIGY